MSTSTSTPSSNSPSSNSPSSNSPSSNSPCPNSPSPTDRTADLLSGVLERLTSVVAGISADQLHDPTPCTDYDVEQLRNHVVGWLRTFADGFADPQGRAPRANLEGYCAPAEPAREVAAAAERLDRALRAGAAERPLRLGEAAMPGPLALGMILWEYQVHGWDLARATGQPWSPAEAAALESLEFAPGMLTPDYQGEGKAFGRPVPVAADAPALDRLLGLSGRDPGWSPSS
jgi:uncharacterized protein (TIGR03086 family)